MIAIPHRVLRCIPHVEPATLKTVHKWCYHCAEAATMIIEAVEHMRVWYVGIFWLVAVALFFVGAVIWREV